MHSSVTLASLRLTPCLARTISRPWGCWTRARRRSWRYRVRARMQPQMKSRCPKVRTQQTFSWIIWTKMNRRAGRSLQEFFEDAYAEHLGPADRAGLGVPAVLAAGAHFRPDG